MTAIAVFLYATGMLAAGMTLAQSKEWARALFHGSIVQRAAALAVLAVWPLAIVPIAITTTVLVWTAANEIRRHTPK